MSDPTVSAIDFKNEMGWIWPTLKLIPSLFRTLNVVIIYDLSIDEIDFTENNFIKK